MVVGRRGTGGAGQRTKPGRRARHAASGIPPAFSRASWSGFLSALEQRAGMASRWEQLNRLNVSDISIINEPLLMQRHGRGEAGSSDLVRLFCSCAPLARALACAGCAGFDKLEGVRPCPQKHGVPMVLI